MSFWLWSKRNHAAPTNPLFLQRAPLGFVRGVYLRQRVEKKSALALEQAFSAFISKNAEKISATFRGKAEPFNSNIGEMQVRVEKDRLVATFRDDRIVAVYVPVE